MAPGWEDVQARIESLAALDQKRVAVGASVHGYAFEAPADADGVSAWLAEHGDWLDREGRVFTTIAEMFTLCPTMAEFHTGFLVREPEMPFAMRLCSFWAVSPPSQYGFDAEDPEPETVPFRWFEEQDKRQRTRQRFQGGLGGLLKMFPRKRKTKG